MENNAVSLHRIIKASPEKVFRLGKVSCGTSLEILQEGLPDAIPTEMCYLGWQESLEKLIKLVEPEIPEA